MWKKVSRFREFLSKLRKFDPTKNAKIGQLWMFVPVKNTKRSHLRKFLSSKTLIYKHTQYVVCNPFPKFYSIFRTYLIAWIVWDIKVLRSLCMWKFYHSKIIALKKVVCESFFPGKIPESVIRESLFTWNALKSIIRKSLFQKKSPFLFLSCNFFPQKFLPLK